jgi:hypothetical protein
MDEVQLHALQWVQKTGAETFGDIMERDLELDFVNAVRLKGTQRRKAAAFWLSLRETRRRRPAPDEGPDEEASVMEELRALASRRGMSKESTWSTYQTQRSINRRVAFADDFTGGRGKVSTVEEEPEEATYVQREIAKRRAGAVDLTQGYTSGHGLPFEEPPVSTADYSEALDKLVSAQLNPNSYVVGQYVQVYSRSQAAWVDARVMSILPDGAINVAYGCQRLQKVVLPDDFDQVLRSVEQSPHSKSLPTSPTSEPVITPMATSSSNVLLSRQHSVPLSRQQEKLREQRTASKLLPGVEGG